MAKSVKLADIAEKLNVSTVTVSKALSDQKGVGEELRTKIKELAKEMGYIPPATRKNQKSYNIGVLVPERYFAEFRSFYWLLYQEVATRAAGKDCFTLLEILSTDNENELILPKLLQEDKVDGMIIIGMPRVDYIEKAKQMCKVPLVCLDFYDSDNECDAVITDNFYGMYQLTNYLFEMGHRKIGYVGSLLYSKSITDRYFGYCKSLLEHHEEVRRDWIIEDRDFQTGARENKFTFQIPKEMPTAFVCNCDMTAGEFVVALQKMGYSVPDDISIVGFDNYFFPEVCPLGITTYAVDMKEMAKKTISILLKKLSGETYKTGIHVIKGKIVIKESVKKL